LDVNILPDRNCFGLLTPTPIYPMIKQKGINGKGKEIST
jgi:hypothetical protein